MQDWDDGQISVLASTYCVGLDNPKVKEVTIVGGCRSAADALQSAGRIQPSDCELERKRESDASKKARASEGARIHGQVSCVSVV
jgi:hypothetical protein